jgi:hypothetical protein
MHLLGGLSILTLTILTVLIESSVQAPSNSSNLIPDYYGIKVQDMNSGETSVNLEVYNPFWIRYSRSYNVIFVKGRTHATSASLNGQQTR